MWYMNKNNMISLEIANLDYQQMEYPVLKMVS